MELEVSIVEEDLPETSSTLGAGFFWKLALERRRNCLKNGIVEGVGENPPGKKERETSRLRLSPARQGKIPIVSACVVRSVRVVLVKGPKIINVLFFYT